MRAGRMVAALAAGAASLPACGDALSSAAVVAGQGTGTTLVHVVLAPDFGYQGEVVETRGRLPEEFPATTTYLAGTNAGAGVDVERYWFEPAGDAPMEVSLDLVTILVIDGLSEPGERLLRLPFVTRSGDSAFVVEGRFHVVRRPDPS